MGHSPAANEAGQEFQKYRLREPLSESFLGTRYRAVPAVAGASRAASNAFGSDVSELRSSAFALRLMRAPTAVLIERVARAAKAVRFIDHPNVLAPIQLIRAQTRLGVITQDIDGVTLSDILRQVSSHGEGLPQGVALRIALDVLEGTEALHASEAGIARYSYACGGLTPDSIHIGRDGRARLLDPGICGSAAGVPHWGHDPVALAYTAPEQSGAEPNFSPVSDMFSIGVILWEMLAGRSLFGAPTAAETLEHLHHAEIPRVQRQHFVRGEPLSAAVAQVVMHALHRDPKLRPANCRELADALRASANASAHREVAEQAQLVAGNSAGVFGGPTRSRHRAGGEFELPTGTMPRARNSNMPAASPIASDMFEPLTARIQPPSGTESAALRSRPPGPITAFPISDFVRAQPSGSRRLYVPLAAAAVVLLGISYLAFREIGGRGDTQQPAAASQVAAPSSPNTEPAAVAPAPTVTVQPSAEPLTPPAIGGPTTPGVTTTVENTQAPSAAATPTPAQPAPSRRSEARRRAARAAAAAEAEAKAAAAPAADSGNTAHGPFIPDDL